MIALIKVPVPVPSVVWLSVINGFAVVDQHTPRAVTVASPAEVTLPPEEAVRAVIAEGVVVVTVGGVISALNDRSPPLVVPSLFTATSLK